MYLQQYRSSDRYYFPAILDRQRMFLQIAILLIVK